MLDYSTLFQKIIDINRTIVSSMSYSFGELLCEIKRTVAHQESRKGRGQRGGQTGRPKGRSKREAKERLKGRPKGSQRGGQRKRPNGEANEEAKWASLVTQ